MSDQTTTSAQRDEIKRQLASWLATPEGTDALRAALEQITRTVVELQDERELDAQTVERSITL